MLERLDFWLMVLTFGLLIYFEGRKRLWPIVRPLIRLASGLFASSDQQAPPIAARRRRPIRGQLGRFMGSFSVVTNGSNGVKPSSHVVTASERGVPPGNSVTEVTVSVAEAAVIAARLTRGMSPSAVAKSLPGYSPRNYGEYATKVSQVKATLEEEERRAVLN